MRLYIEHQTQYVYSEVVTYAIQQLRLTPQSGLGQQVGQWDIKVKGALHESSDAFGNAMHTLVLDNPHEALYILVAGEVETGIDTLSQPAAMPLQIFLRDTELTHVDKEIAAFALAYKGKPIQSLVDAICGKMRNVKGSTEVDTTAAQAFALAQGVGQDYVHVFVACCRSLGLPARYVSGYLFTEDGSLMQTHAWADVWIDEAWKSIDVVNACLTNECYVRLATGLDYRGASPVTGSRVGGGVEGLASSVTVNTFASNVEKHQKMPQDELLSLALQAQQAQQ
jgi:transglutaminase-like putative cysteine protease